MPNRGLFRTSPLTRPIVNSPSPTWSRPSRDMPSWRHEPDSVAYLTLWLALLYGITARQIVPGLGAQGSPAMLVALPTFGIWLACWLLPRSGFDRGRHPVRVLLLVHLSYLVISYAVAMSRTLTDLEATGATRELMTGFAMVGIALFAADGVRSVARLEVLLQRAVWATLFLSSLGIVQFFTSQQWLFTMPGLTWNHPPPALASRGPFVRPVGTTLHSIEFSVITAAMLPLALHFALYSVTVHRRRNATAAATLIAFAIPLSVSRTALVSLVAGLAVLLAVWRGRRLLNALATIAIAVPVLWATVPGIVGTFVSMFSDTDDDPSIQARVRRVPRVMSLIRERPWLGLGNGTWSVEDWFLIDNEIYVTTLEQGMIGMGLTFVVIGLPILLALTLRHVASVDEVRGHLALSLAASILAIGASLFTFDSFHYRIITGTLFLLIGCVGALWRLSAASEHLEQRLLPSRRGSSDDGA